MHTEISMPIGLVAKKHFLLIAIVHANFETTVTIRTIELNSIWPEKTWMACMGSDTDGA